MTESLRDALRVAGRIQADVDEFSKPPLQGKEPRTNEVLEPAWFQQKKYERQIRVVKQINGTYENGWYDACAAMLRRIVETLLIDAYKAKEIEQRIKNKEGEFLRLGEIIKKACEEEKLDFSSDNKRILRDIAKLGNTAAHNRRTFLRREYLERRLLDIQLLVQHLIEI